MWFARNVPAREHDSCARKFAELTERLERLELSVVEQKLQVLDVAEKVAEKLAERVRRRKVEGNGVQGDAIDRMIAIRRGRIPEP